MPSSVEYGRRTAVLEKYCNTILFVLVPDRRAGESGKSSS